MADITLGGKPCHTNGDLPSVGTKLPSTTLTTTSLKEVALDTYEGKKVLNIFPSVDTGVCGTSVRKFNELAAGVEGARVFCISNDLPFAMKRFCGAEGIERVEVLSGFRTNFAEALGAKIVDGGFAGLMARAVVVVDADNTVVYTELVPEIGQEPNYDAALAALK